MSPRTEQPDISGTPTLNDWVAFVDESGDHSLESIDANFPVFALSMCLCRWDDYLRVIVPSMKKLKVKYFGHDNVVLHESDLVKEKGIVKDLGPSRRHELLNELTHVIRHAPFSLIGVVIDKPELSIQNPVPMNPYAIALEYALTRAAEFLQRQSPGARKLTVIAESRGSREDQELTIAFNNVLISSHVSLRALNTAIVFVEKHMNTEGLQLADLTARPIALSVLRPTQINRTYEVLKLKYVVDGNGAYQGIGLRVFP